jgi:hypothetical protein
MISLILPSYQRPKQAEDTHGQWITAADLIDDFELILGLSYGDPYEDEYKDRFELDATIVVVPSRTMVAATNAAAAQAKGDILILISDDMYPCFEWDIKVKKAFDALPQGPAVLQVSDGIRSDILTIPIMNRAAYELLGYMYHPMYMSMYADNDLRATCEKHGILHMATEIEFDHRHYSVGKSQQDMTYKHENSRTAMDHGQRIFERRKKLGFPIL